MITADIKTIDARHSGQFVANILFDAQQIQSLVGVGVLNIMKDTLTVLGLVGLMFYQNWKLAIFAILMIQNGSIIEYVPTDGMTDCLKQRRVIERNIGANQVGMVMQCKEVKAELYEDMGRLKIKKIYD